MHDTMTAIRARARALLRGFAASRRGNVAMMFGLMLVPMMIATGAGLDYARAALVKSQIADALDAAALAVGSSGFTTQDAAHDAAQAIFNANYKGPGKATITVISFDAKGSVTLSASSSVTTTLLQVVDKDSIAVQTSSTVVWGQSKLWVSLVLDNSTSMNDGGRNTKMAALQSAAQTLLTKLKGAASTDGDVQVGIVPFTRVVNVGTANASKTWVNWAYWEAPPANATLGSGTDANGPSVNCPFSDNVQGYHCLSSGANNAGTASKIPASGLICPSIDNGRVNTDHQSIYYNGCWNSTPTSTLTTTTTKSTPTTTTYSCTTINGGSASCTQSSQNHGSASTSTSTSTASGYTGDSSSNSTGSLPTTSSDGSQHCTSRTSGHTTTTTCTFTRTTVATATATTTAKTGAAPYSHAWSANSHSSWAGCILDRAKDDDISNTAPAGTHGFPAVNPDLCFSATITPLGYNWTNLSQQIGQMTPNGYTNQPIGIAHGWQMLTPGDPWATPAVPVNTSRYIILFSDGLNTQDRWYVSSNTNVGDTRIDARQAKANSLASNGVCDNAKADGIIIYTLYIHLSGDPADSPPLKNCATDSSKYFNLASTDQIATAFDAIAQQITSVRVSQ